MKNHSLGNDNRSFSYEMGGQWVNAVRERKDLGVKTTLQKKISKHFIDC